MQTLQVVPPTVQDALGMSCDTNPSMFKQGPTAQCRPYNKPTAASAFSFRMDHRARARFVGSASWPAHSCDARSQHLPHLEHALSRRTLIPLKVSSVV